MHVLLPLNALLLHLLIPQKMSEDAVFAMGKAAELLILELTMQSFQSMKNTTKQSLSKDDIKSALAQGEKYDLFLDLLDD